MKKSRAKYRRAELEYYQPPQQLNKPERNQNIEGRKKYKIKFKTKMKKNTLFAVRAGSSATPISGKVSKLKSKKINKIILSMYTIQFRHYGFTINKIQKKTNFYQIENQNVF